CGRAAPGVELAILDDTGRPVVPGTPGELYVRRFPGMFDGYYKDAEATREAQRGEWATVGDVAWMDDEGFVYICDRKRDLIISGSQHLPRRDRGRAPPPPGDRRRRGLRRARRRLGRARPRRGAATPGRCGHGRGGRPLRAAPHCGLQGPARDLVPRGVSAGPRGQAPQARAARLLLGGAP